MHEAIVSPRSRLVADVQLNESEARQANEKHRGLDRQSETGHSIALVVNNENENVVLAPIVAADTHVSSVSGNVFSSDSAVLGGDQPFAGKRIFDVFGALFLIIAFLPLVIPIVVAMSVSGGSIIYKHRRVGRYGKIFKCYKFRTMVPNADKVLQELLDRDPQAKVEWLRDHKLRTDPRITFIGTFLRRTSLDELPQLLNVLRGQMSLVGPRPVIKDELLRYGRSASAYLSVKPGLTGLWQVSGRNNLDYRRRVALDVYYVRNQSLLLDFFILLKTIRVILVGDGAY